MSEKTESTFVELEALAAQYAQAQAEADYLESFKKSKLAILMKKAEAAGHKTAAAQEREAYADPEYETTLRGLQAATETALALKWKLEIFRIKFEQWRTKQANVRAEMNLR